MQHYYGCLVWVLYYRLWVSAQKSPAVPETFPGERKNSFFPACQDRWWYEFDISGNWRQHKRNDARLFVCVLLMHAYRLACLSTRIYKIACPVLDSSCIIIAALSCFIVHTYPIFFYPDDEFTAQWSSLVSPEWHFAFRASQPVDIYRCKTWLERAKRQ